MHALVTRGNGKLGTVVVCSLRVEGWYLVVAAFVTGSSLVVDGVAACANPARWSTRS